MHYHRQEMVTLSDITRKTAHQSIYFVSLSLFVISLPSSRFLLTLSEVLLIVNWLAEAGFRSKFRKFFACRPAVAFILIYLLYVVGLLWSEDMRYALNHDLLHKLPTLFLPLIIVTSPMLNAKEIRLLLLFFISSVLAVSFIGLIFRLGQPGIPYRQSSPFIPSIYYGMMLIIAAFQLPLLIRQVSNNKLLYFAGLTISAWLIFFLFYMRAFSGVVSFIGVMAFVMIMWVVRLKNVISKISLVLLLMLVSGLAVWPMINIYKQTHSEVETDFRTLGKFTEKSNPYFHDTIDILRENGHLVYIYLADEELKEAWSERSQLDYEGNDLSDNPLRYTLYRYLSSKGLRKDKHDLMLLSDNEIRAVEAGTVTYLNLRRPGFYIRVYEEMMGLYIYNKSSHKDVSWGSLTKRIDLWRASWLAFKKRPVFGWGTGSILHAVDYGFKQTGSPLSGLNMKPHSQYLYLLLTEGLSGLIIFIALYSYIVIKTGAYKHFMFGLFIIVFTINFLGNNSLEDQLGQNLFVFFTLFYFFYYPSLNIRREFIY